MKNDEREKKSYDAEDIPTYVHTFKDNTIIDGLDEGFSASFVYLPKCIPDVLTG